MKWYSVAALVTGAWISACTMAAAEFTSWESSAYPFAKVKTIYVGEMDTRDVSLPMVKEQKVKAILDNKVTKLSLPQTLSLTSGFGAPAKLYSPKAPKASEEDYRAYEDPLVSAALDSGAEVYILPRLTRWNVDSYLIPGHTEWRSRQVKDSWRDKDGVWHDSYHTETYPEYIPDQWVPYCEVTVSFEWFDRDSGQLIASSEDARERGSEDNPQGVYERIVERFVKNLKKTVKR